jgi:hypothetical protein
MDETIKLKKELEKAQTRLKRIEDVIFGFKDDPVFKAKIQKISGESGGSNARYLDIPRPETIFISSGVISITQGYHTVDTEGGAASDEINTINDNGFPAATILVLRATSASRTVILKDDTGNLRLAGDCTLDDNDDTITLIGTGAVWYEVARSNNET